MADIGKRMIKITLHGFDARATKTMQLYLQGPCRGAAIITDKARVADVDIFDADILASKKLLDQYAQAGFARPVIVMSLREYNQGGAIYVKKPVLTDDLLKALNQAKNQIVGSAPKSPSQQKLKPPTPASTKPESEPEQEPGQFKIDLFKFDKDHAKILSDVSMDAKHPSDVDGLSEEELRELAKYRELSQKIQIKPVEVGSETLNSLDDWFNL